MTVYEIREEVGKLKPFSLRTVYNNITVLGIKPIAEVQQAPTALPTRRSTRILARYGLA